jgi:hypothetical protein
MGHFYCVLFAYFYLHTWANIQFSCVVWCMLNKKFLVLNIPLFMRAMTGVYRSPVWTGVAYLYNAITYVWGVCFSLCILGFFLHLKGCCSNIPGYISLSVLYLLSPSKDGQRKLKGQLVCVSLGSLSRELCYLFIHSFIYGNK